VPLHEQNSPSTAVIAGPADQGVGYRAVLRQRAFLGLWTAQVLSQIADNLVYFTLLVQVYRQTGSNAAVSLLVLCVTAPAVIFGVLAGVLVDHADKRQVLVATNVARALLCLGFLLLGHQVAVLFLLAFLASSVRQFFVPAEAATIPRLVAPGQLVAANSLFTLTYNLSFIIGMSGAGPLIKLFGTDAVFGLAGLSFAGAALALRAVPPEGVVAPPRGSVLARARLVLSDLLAGWRYLRQNPPIFQVLLALALAWSLAGVTAALGPGYAATVLGLEEADAFYLVAPAGLGVISGSLIIGRYGRHLPHRWLIARSFIATGVIVIILAIYRGLTRLLWGDLLLTAHPGGLPGFLVVVMALAFLLGVANAGVIIPANVVLQQETPPGMRGRIFGVLNTLGNLGSTLPVFVIGVLADLWGVGRLMVAIGLLIILLGWASSRSAAPARPSRS
jgi:MFS family permease